MWGPAGNLDMAHPPPRTVLGSELSVGSDTQQAAAFRPWTPKNPGNGVKPLPIDPKTTDSEGVFRVTGRVTERLFSRGGTPMSTPPRSGASPS